ncbi:MAG: UDP-N-acetylmuramoyl-tripeptide--D-alanyl-D-alanine ligase [Methylococcaceae bacterium]|nr:UDP-N-acetylmuramoyl-tripeptide--D-alanyl-D-alanine ligase [Methylococcaceae bacterium]
MSLRLSELARITSGEWRGEDVEFATVSIDTRTLQAGDLFIAIPGPRFDGHDFIALAASQGACAALVERQVDSPLPQVIVADTRIALGRLGATWRRANPARVVGLTGSNGKTTTKEMIAAILGVKDEVLSTRGNLNNDLGVPLTLLRLGPNHAYAVIEMGANHPGEIDYVAHLAAPDVALITNAGAAHLEGFGSLEGVARTKGEIIAALSAKGVALLNADDEFFDLWREIAGTRRVIGFGFGPKADVRGLEDSVRGGFEQDGFKTRFGCEHLGARHEIVLNLAGRHNVVNALAAAAACLALGLDFGQIADGLSRLAPVAGRVQPARAGNGALLINDTYNANPASFKAALDVLLELPGEPWVALGAFGELGEASADLHAELGALAKSRGVVRLFATGPNANRAVESFGAGADHFARQEDLIEQLTQELRADVALLVKGSRSQRMERVIEALCAQEKACC